MQHRTIINGEEEDWNWDENSVWKSKAELPTENVALFEQSKYTIENVASLPPLLPSFLL